MSKKNECVVPEDVTKNPITEGKARLIADFMLKGWTNREIMDHIKSNKLDANYRACARNP